MIYPQGLNDQNPYTYGMGGNVPSPMNSPFGQQPEAPNPGMGGFPSTPPIPEWTPQPPFQNLGMMTPHYARGGYVEGLPEMGEELSEQGRHGDTMLAHISPSEALMLKAMGGSGTINPETGLPEFFGFGRWFQKNIIRPIRRAIPQSVKKHIGPALGTIVGNMLVPGLGAVIGGGIGGSFGHPKTRMGPVKGALMSQAYSAGLNAAGAGANAAGMSGVGGTLQKLGGPNYLSSLVSNVSPKAAGILGPSAQTPEFLSSMGKGISSMFSPASKGIAAHVLERAAAGPSAAAPGFFSSLTGGNLLNTALLGTAVMGTLGRREKTPGSEPKSLAEAMQQAHAKPQWRPDQYPTEGAYGGGSYGGNPYAGNPRSRNRKYRPMASGYNPAYQGEHEFFEEEPYRMSQGGFLRGNIRGQDDVIRAHLPGGEIRLAGNEYIIPADVVSDAGDGNSEAGGENFDGLVASIRRHKKRTGFPPKIRPLESYLHKKTKY